VANDSEKKYRALITLTEEGKKTADIIDTKVESAVQTGGGDLTDAQRKAFYEALTHISNNLDNYLVDEKETED
jgi:hypothetical protein